MLLSNSSPHWSTDCVDCWNPQFCKFTCKHWPCYCVIGNLLTRFSGYHHNGRVIITPPFAAYSRSISFHNFYSRNLGGVTNFKINVGLYGRSWIMVPRVSISIVWFLLILVLRFNHSNPRSNTSMRKTDKTWTFSGLKATRLSHQLAIPTKTKGSSVARSTCQRAVLHPWPWQCLIPGVAHLKWIFTSQ